MMNLGFILKPSVTDPLVKGSFATSVHSSKEIITYIRKPARMFLNDLYTKLLSNMKNLIILSLFFIPTVIIGQDLKCEDFFEGEFIGTSPKFPGVEWKITRKKDSQIEWPSKIPQKYLDLGFPVDTLYAKINWEDDCNYSIIYDGDKMELDEHAKMTNDSGGIVIKMKKIESKCFFYESQTELNGEKIKINGKVCKVN